MECKVARKVKDEIRKTENTILRAPGSLSESSLNSNANDMTALALRNKFSLLESFTVYYQHAVFWLD